MFYAIYFFKRYSNIKEISISYVYVEHNHENKIILERQYLDRYISELFDLINAAEEDTVFQKNETRLCDYCDFRTHCRNN